MTPGGKGKTSSATAPSIGQGLRKETKVQKSWMSFKTLEDWKKEFNRHPEWASRSTAAMQKDTESSASAFLGAFPRFCEANSKGEIAAYRQLIASIFPLERIHHIVVLFGHESLAETEGKDRRMAASEIDKVNKFADETYDLKLPSGISITLYSVQMTTGSAWVCTKKEWQTFLAEYGLKEKKRHCETRSNTSLFELL